MPQDSLGRYRLLNELGRGAMGHVFLAHDPEIDRNVALKTIQLIEALPEADRQETRERVLREARAAGKLLHPGIVTLFDVGEADGVLYLAMEHVEGETLDQFCRAERRLQQDEIVTLIAGVAEALEYAHHNGVVHRDIKPANLMRVAAGEAKVMDFGLARAAEANVTQDGALLGTPSYMSPEQIKGEELDGRSDLFSLAVVLYELLTCERPFPGDSVSSILYRIVHEPVRELDENSDAVPAAFRPFLKQALAKDREQRFPHGGAFAAALRSALQEKAAPAPAPTIEPTAAEALPPRRSIRRTNRSRVPAIAIGLLLVAAVAAGWAFRDRLPLNALNALRPTPEPIWNEATVRTEPEGLTVTLNGAPVAAGALRWEAGGEPQTLATEHGCRTIEQPLTDLDAGSEIVLVAESTSFEGTFDVGIAGGKVSLNGRDLGAAPLDLELDLCQDNRVEWSAPDYRDGVIELAAQMRPIEVRTALGAFTPQPIPKLTLALPDAAVPLVWYVDGSRLKRGVSNVELSAGQHKVRFKNDAYWIDETRTITLEEGQEPQPSWNIPPLTTLVVQAFPANCRVAIRRPGGRWKDVDDTPAEVRLARGSYDVRVTLNATGETREQRVKLEAGENPPLRVSFGGGS